MRLAFFMPIVVALGFPFAALANITIKDRTTSQPLVLDQQEDYALQKVFISGVTDVAALTLTGRINSVTLSNCIFTNINAGMNGKAVCAESAGAIVGSFTAFDSAFEDAQNQLLCLREGAFGIVSFQRCRFKTSDAFLKKIYSDDPWRTKPPTTEFANIERLELIDNEYSNTLLIIHPTVKLVVFRGDITNVRIQSPDATHVIRLQKDQDPSSILPDGTALAQKPADAKTPPAEAGESKRMHHEEAAADSAIDQESRPAEAAQLWIERLQEVAAHWCK